MNDVALSINATMGKTAAARVDGLEAKVKASMKAVIDGDWMASNDDALFRAGVAGALLDVGSDSEDGQRLTSSIEFLKRFSAFLNAASAGLDVSPPDLSDEDPLPLMKWWHEVKG
jgi:hypothetical protein